MEIRHFQTFIAIVDAGGYTKAAEQLGYAQSTITAHIQILESELGKPLFSRLGKKVVVTDTGRELVPYARKMIALYKDIKSLAMADEVSGELNIGAGESLSIYRLGPILKEYKKNYPNVNIILKNSICSDLKKRLRNGELDIIFTIEPEVKEDDLVLAASKAERMLLITGGGCKMELSSSNMIFTEKGCRFRMVFENYLSEKKIKYSNPLELTSIEAIKKCVACGLGISFLPLYTVENELKDESIVGVEIEEEYQNFKTQMIFHRAANRSKALEAFMEIAITHFEKFE